MNTTQFTEREVIEMIASILKSNCPNGNNDIVFGTDGTKLPISYLSIGSAIVMDDITPKELDLWVHIIANETEKQTWISNSLLCLN